MAVTRILLPNWFQPISPALYITQAPVVQKPDSAIHRINHYPGDNGEVFGKPLALSPS